MRMKGVWGALAIAQRILAKAAIPPTPAGTSLPYAVEAVPVLSEAIPAPHSGQCDARPARPES